MNTNGYGFVTVGGRRVAAHRLAWALHNGADPTGKVVMHTCDNPPCINPEHLVLGTHADNVADKVRKGRSCFGERSGTSKLTWAKVRAIRAATGTLSEIGSMFGVHLSNVSLIRRGLTWKEIHGPSGINP